MVLINSDDLEKGCINIATNVKEATHVYLGKLIRSGTTYVMQ